MNKFITYISSVIFFNIENPIHLFTLGKLINFFI
jgi:hypothetical protein